MTKRVTAKDPTHTGYTARHERILRKHARPAGNASSLLPLSQQASSYTLTTADAETCVEFTSGSAVNCTIPPNSSQAFDVGAWVQIRQAGTGQVTFVAGAGVTLYSPASATKTCQQWTTAIAHQRAVDEWVLVGDLV